MKIKKEYIILAIIITALSVYLVMRRGDRTLYQLPEIAHVDRKEITKLQITKGKTVIVLNKKDNESSRQGCAPLGLLRRHTRSL